MPIRAPPGTPTGPTPDGGYVSPSGLQYSPDEWRNMRQGIGSQSIYFNRMGNSVIRENPAIIETKPTPPIQTTKPDPSFLVNRVLVSSASYQTIQQQKDVVEKAAQRDNLILGFIPNPLAKYEPAVASFLASTPMRKSITSTMAKYPIDDSPPVKFLESSPTFQKFESSSTGKFVTSLIGGYAEDVQQRPIKFTANVVAGYGVGKVFQAGSTGIASLAAAGKISQRTATVIPKTAAGLMAGAFVAGSGISIASEPTPEAKGRRAGIITSEATAMIIGGGLAFRRAPLRWGFSTQEQKIKTVDLTVPTVDLRPEVDLSTAKIYNPAAYEQHITRAERAMIIQQYQLSPLEIRLAKANRLTLNDILNVRIRTEIPETSSLVEVKPMRPLVEIRPKSISKVIPQEVQPVRVKRMSGFVPDIFTTVVTTPKVANITHTPTRVIPLVKPKTTPIVITATSPRTMPRLDERILPVVITRIITTHTTDTPTIVTHTTLRVPRISTTTIKTTPARGRIVVSPRATGFPFLPFGSGGWGRRGIKIYRRVGWLNPTPTLKSFIGNYGEGLFGVQNKKRGKGKGIWNPLK